MSIYDVIDHGNDTKLETQRKMIESMQNRKQHNLILYANRDKKEAQQLCDLLESGSDIKCWMSPRDVPEDLDYHTAMGSAMTQCLSYIIVYSSITTNVNADGGIAEEITSAGFLVDHYRFNIIAVPTTNHADKNDLNDLLSRTPFSKKKNVIWSKVPMDDPSFKKDGKNNIIIALAASALVMLAESSEGSGSSNWKMDLKSKKKSWWKFWK